MAHFKEKTQQVYETEIDSTVSDKTNPINVNGRVKWSASTTTLMMMMQENCFEREQMFNV